jgi:hypothetical protein
MPRSGTRLCHCPRYVRQSVGSARCHRRALLGVAVIVMNCAPSGAGVWGVVLQMDTGNAQRPVRPVRLREKRQLMRVSTFQYRW